jgi:hypothetical protein
MPTQLTIDKRSNQPINHLSMKYLRVVSTKVMRNRHPPPPNKLNTVELLKS